MTRDRKKMFTHKLQELISSLEMNNDILKKRVAAMKNGNAVENKTVSENPKNLSFFDYVCNGYHSMHEMMNDMTTVDVAAMDEAMKRRKLA